MADTNLPIWRQRLERSLHVNKNEVESRFFQVASVSKAGHPKNRTMVFRGFHSGRNCLLSVTDTRSEKMNDWLTDKSKFEICWYFVGSREQYRIAGEVHILSVSIPKNQASDSLGDTSKEVLLREQWSNLSLSAREQFYWPKPKAPYDDTIALTDDDMKVKAQASPTISESQSKSSVHNKTAEKQLEMNDNFCVVIFIPFSVDYLNLKPKPQSLSQQRCLYYIDNNWTEVIVNP